MTDRRISIDGDYLIIAPRRPEGSGYYHMLTERAFLVENIKNFMDNFPIHDAHDIMIYELREVNMKRIGMAGL